MKKHPYLLLDCLCLALIVGGIISTGAGIAFFMLESPLILRYVFLGIGLVWFVVGLIIALIVHARKKYRLADGTEISKAQYEALLRQGQLARENKITKAQYQSRKKKILDDGE